MIKGLIKRGIFNYSNKEYLTNIRNNLITQSFKTKSLKYSGLDSKEISLKLYGYPNKETPKRRPLDEDAPTDF